MTTYGDGVSVPCVMTINCDAPWGVPGDGVIVSWSVRVPSEAGPERIGIGTVELLRGVRAIVCWAVVSVTSASVIVTVPVAAPLELGWNVTLNEHWLLTFARVAAVQPSLPMG